MTDPKHGELREVPPKTPLIDAVEQTGKVGRIVGFFLRPLKAWREKRARKKAQEHIDKRWHDPLRVGKPERSDTP
jgi:hypothetical protein